MDNPVDPYLGQMIRGYRLEEVLGDGKLITLFRGRTQELWLLPEIAIALIRMPGSLVGQAQEKFLARFSHEADRLIRLRHSSLFPLFGYGVQEDYCYLLMPNVSGLTLAQRLKEQARWQPADILKILTPVAQALDYIHNQGQVHQFLHPASILFQKGIPPQITSLRLSQMLLADDILFPSTEEVQFSTSLSHLKNLAGAYSGMAEYLAPEVVRGSVPDPRSDIYSFGVIMFEMLGGRTPFTGKSYPDIALKHIREPLPSLRTLCADLPTVLELVVGRALHHDPQHRFQTAGELIAAYSRAISKHSHTIYPTRLRKERQTQPLPPVSLSVLPSLRAEPEALNNTSVHEHSALVYQMTVPATLQNPVQDQETSLRNRSGPNTDALHASNDGEEMLTLSEHPVLLTPAPSPIQDGEESAHEHIPTTALRVPDASGTLYPKNREIMAMVQDFRHKMERFQARDTHDQG